MPEPPFLLTPNKIDQRATLDELVQEVSRLSQSTQLLMDEIFNERIGGANLGDVFEIGNDDILSIRLKDDDGLRKVNSELALKLSAVGGMQVSSNGLKIKIKTDGGLQTDAEGLSFTGTITFNNTGLKIKDTDASHVLTIKPGSDLTGNKTLTVITGDADRTFTLASTHIDDASASHTITDPADTPITADALRDDLVTNTIPSIETALNNLGTKINDILTRLENAGISLTS